MSVRLIKPSIPVVLNQLFLWHLESTSEPGSPRGRRTRQLARAETGRPSPYASLCRIPWGDEEGGAGWGDLQQALQDSCILFFWSRCLLPIFLSAPHWVVLGTTLATDCAPVSRTSTFSVLSTAGQPVVLRMTSVVIALAFCGHNITINWAGKTSISSTSPEAHMHTSCS